MEDFFNNYPSQFAINEEVQLNLGVLGIVKPAKIEAIYFTERKVYYDISVLYLKHPEDANKDLRCYMEKIDSIFVEHLGQKEPNRFALLSDVKAYIEQEIEQEISKPSIDEESLKKLKDRLNNIFNKDDN